MSLSCARSRRRSVRRSIFSGGAGLPAMSRRVETGNGIRRGRFSGTELSLVFPIAGQRLDDIAQCCERGTIHGKRRTALRHCSHRSDLENLPRAAGDMENVSNVGIQCRERQTCRSYTRSKTRVINRRGHREHRGNLCLFSAHCATSVVNQLRQ